MRRIVATLALIGALTTLVLTGVEPAGATPTNPGYGMTCNGDYCTGWTASNTLPNIQYYHTWSHTFDPNGNGVWDITVMQWYVCNGPGCGDTSHPIGWVLHIITYDWGVPHMEHLVGPQATGTLEIEGHAGNLTGNVLRWSPCSNPTGDTYNVSGGQTSGSQGYFACNADWTWHNGGGWEWLNPTYVGFKTVIDNRTGGWIAVFNINT